MYFIMERIFIISLISLCFLGQAMAQNNDGKVVLPDSLPFNEIVFKEVAISGNEKTKEHIIVRELDFKLGDILTAISIKGKSNIKLKRAVVGNSSELALRMHYSRENIIITNLI